MGSLYEEIDDALAGMLKADGWFFHPGPTPPAGPNHVRLVDTEAPETVAPVAEFTDYFPENVLPAVLVLSLLENPRVTEETIGEVRYEVPVKVLGVLTGGKKAKVRADAMALAANIERVLLTGRDAAGAPHLDGSHGCFLRPPTSTVDVKRNERNRRWYGTVETDVAVVAIV